MGKLLLEPGMGKPGWARQVAYCFVSGHDFSRATSPTKGQGFSSCHHKKSARISNEKKALGLKPPLFFALLRHD
jgi:hypothetical protein